MLMCECLLAYLMHAYQLISCSCSYGACCEADFSATRLALLNRGVVVVVAHVRGGSEMGRQWHEEPSGEKYLCKENT